MNRLTTRAALCLSINLVSACGVVPPAYAPDWPALPTDTKARCAPPIGTFANSSARSSFADKGEHYPAPTLTQVLGVHSRTDTVTHLGIELSSGNRLRITALHVTDGMQIEVGEQHLDLADAICREGLWSIVTTPTHMSWDGGEHEHYDPLFMLTMPAATMGLGLLLTPLSEWWRFSFAIAEEGSLVLRRQKLSSGMLALVVYSRSVVEDDRFLYDAIEPGGVFVKSEPAVVAHELPTLDTPVCEVADERSAAQQYAAGMSFYRRAMYEPALACFLLAADTPDGGSRDAMWQLCVVYELGQGVEADLQTAKLWCERAGGE